VAHQFKIALAEQMGHVVLASRKEVIHAENIIAPLDEPIAKVTAKKPGAPRDQYSLLPFFTHYDSFGRIFQSKWALICTNSCLKPTGRYS
jgi:hypothetical protein